MESKEHKLIRGFSTRAVHAGVDVDPTTGAVIPPIHVSSTYEVFPDQTPKFIYGRFDNPTRVNLEKALASLENAKYCIATSSGLAAVSIVYHMLRPGDHVVSNDDLYGGTTNYLLEQGTESEGIKVDFVDLRDLKAFTAAIKENTKLVWVETPTNPTLKILDVEALSAICKEKKLILVVDNTFLTPYLQNPLDLGADIVIHSCTKYIGGHSDIIMGCAMTNNEEYFKKMKKNSSTLGCCPGPFDCFLASRGIKTLAIRVAKSSETAMKLAEVLANHPKITEVMYPGLPNHPGYDIIKKHARGFGSMITIKLKDPKNANEFYRKLSVFGHAVSLGGVESLVCIPVMITHRSVPKDLREKLGITESTIRLSIGIEDFEDLRDDLLQALEAA
jgi:cystathionine beta-lyase/cystathionine gamma-synthase